MSELGKMLKEWNTPGIYKSTKDADKLIHMMQIELAGKVEVIKALNTLVELYKTQAKETNDMLTALYLK